MHPRKRVQKIVDQCQQLLTALCRGRYEKSRKFDYSFLFPDEIPIESIDEVDFPSRKQVGDNTFAYILPSLFGVAKICVGPMTCKMGFDDWYEYDSMELAESALSKWNGIGEPTKEGMIRKSDGTGVVRVKSRELFHSNVSRLI